MELIVCSDISHLLHDFLVFIFNSNTKSEGTQNVISICMLIVLVCFHKICPVLGNVLMYKRELFIKIDREEDFSLIFLSKLESKKHF